MSNEPKSREPGISPLNRVLQLTMLLELQAAYPDRLDVRALTLTEDDAGRNANLSYLREHGLCSIDTLPGRDGSLPAGAMARITAAGLDFLADDGGLTAILGVVTVKLHADTIRDLLAAKVDASDLPPEKKSALREQIKKLPEMALQAATTDLVKLGLDSLPSAGHWLERIFGI